MSFANKILGFNGKAQHLIVTVQQKVIKSIVMNQGRNWEEESTYNILRSWFYIKHTKMNNVITGLG